ncbi:hypothetical protein TTHERM_000202959 (macronuclear) [Tetrahymena thermophila SB210]|uniref:Uncharacterized protein n=1 Tax=Tetrahymena thermophila (strain SB210) TaxID=312017 RepID=W7XB91_TETTS|nr:hypothetical protein TTHERM_000202959 [Tetrahymena thermophila SB210]EWS76650.1 hypothetical protein TTHERM_000202959 [Tetrahymena thermophila SB210]|eukprot:XP_012650818.1 hypothetical protein TTHERM_000202959 [Tetrahymena thermophila SB210]
MKCAFFRRRMKNYLVCLFYCIQKYIRLDRDFFVLDCLIRKRKQKRERKNLQRKIKEKQICMLFKQTKSMKRKRYVSFLSQFIKFSCNQIYQSKSSMSYQLIIDKNKFMNLIKRFLSQM